MQLFKSVFLPTIWFGLDLLNGESGPLKTIQVAINDMLRSIVQLPLITPTQCILTESGCVTITIEWQYLQRRVFRGAVINKDLPKYLSSGMIQD